MSKVVVVQDQVPKLGKWHLNLGRWNVGDIGYSNLQYRSLLNECTESFSDWANITSLPQRLHLVVGELGLECMWSRHWDDKRQWIWGYLNVGSILLCIWKEDLGKMYDVYTTRIVILLLGNLEDTVGPEEECQMNDVSLWLQWVRCAFLPWGCPTCGKAMWTTHLKWFGQLAWILWSQRWQRGWGWWSTCEKNRRR
jgi:hypothetical protein